MIKLGQHNAWLLNLEDLKEFRIELELRSRACSETSTICGFEGPCARGRCMVL
jgi:hypothetical protein